MEKWLCWGGVASGGLLLVLFGLDLVMTIIGAESFRPFGGNSVLDVICILASAVLLYLSLDALRDVK